jgi:hypothetical protein
LLDGFFLLPVGMREGIRVDGYTALWAAVVASGLYHGLNPGMGWPLAVAAGLTERRGSAVARTLVPLAAGHLISIAMVLLPFAALTLLLDWSREIRIGAGIGTIAFAAVLALYPRHPRWMTRIRPRQVALWSFAVGLLHGTGLMLVPVLLGLCAIPSAIPEGFMAAESGGATNAGLALAVAVTHTAALIAASGGLAWVVFRVLGLEVLTRSWLDLSRIWAGSLGLAGAVGLWAAL